MFLSTFNYFLWLMSVNKVWIVLYSAYFCFSIPNLLLYLFHNSWGLVQSIKLWMCIWILLPKVCMWRTAHDIFFQYFKNDPLFFGYGWENVLIRRKHKEKIFLPRGCNANILVFLYVYAYTYICTCTHWYKLIYMECIHIYMYIHVIYD